MRNVGIPPKFYLPGICLGGSQSAVAARFLVVVPYGVGLSLQIEVRKLALNPEFENVKGLSGKKAYGTFTALDTDSEEDIKMQYDIMVLSQPGGAQEFFFMYREEDKHAMEIIEKIQNSIELRKAKK